MFPRPKILFLASLLFVALLNSIPTYLLNVTGAYVIIMLVYRRLLTTNLHGKAAV